MKKLLLVCLCLIVLIGLGRYIYTAKKPLDNTASNTKNSINQKSGTDSTIPAAEDGKKTAPQLPTGNNNAVNNKNTDASIPSDKQILLTLYFPKSDNSAVITEKREVTVKSGAIVRAAVLTLLEGPTGENLKKPMPEGTRLIDLNKKDDLVILNFSKEFMRVNGLSETLDKISIVNTLTEIKGVGKVKILIEGKELIAPSGLPAGELKRAALDENGHPIPAK